MVVQLLSKRQAIAYGNESRCWMDTFVSWLEDMDAAWASDNDDSRYRNTEEGKLSMYQ